MYEFYKDLGNKTQDDIDNSGFPLWYRDRFTELLKQNFVWNEDSDKHFINPPLNVIDGNIPDPIGRVFEYKGLGCELTAGQSSIVVNEGDRYWICDKRMILGSMPVSKCNESSLRELLSASTFISEMSHTTYFNYYQDYMADKHGFERVIELTKSIPTYLSSRANTLTAANPSIRFKKLS